MPDPFTIAVAATATAETAGALVGTAEAAGLAVEGTALSSISVSGELAAAKEVLTTAEAAGGLGSVGGSTEAFLNMLDIKVGTIGESVLSQVEASGRFDAAAWRDAGVSEGVIKPNMVAERFRALREPANLESYARHLESRDPAFAREFGRRTEQLGAAKGPADLDAALQQIRKSTAGQLGESAALDGFRPYFEGIEIQHRVELPGGTTIIDARLTGARQPVVLGRGLGVPEGGNLAMEVKTGQSSYLAREIPHITEKQVLGHLQVGDQSLVVMSRDVYGLAAERTARDAVSAAGSRIMALLPEKSVVDEVLIRIIGERAGLV